MNWPKSVSATWFIMMILAGGAIVIVQEFTGVSQVPVQLAGRFALIGIALVAALSHHRSPLPGVPRLAISLFCVAMFGEAALSLVRGQPSSEVYNSFQFMNGIGAFLALSLLLPIIVRPGLTFKLIAASAVAFGLAQVLAQDLLVPEGYREQYGIVWDHFVNGQVRSSSFFASPPRFAELLAILAGFLQFWIFTGERRLLVKIAGYLVVLFVLFNTFSRSGYILWIVLSVIQVICVAVSGTLARRVGSLKILIVLALLCLLAAVALSGAVPLDSSVSDTASFTARQGHWDELFDKFNSAGVIDTLLGTGNSAYHSFLSSDYFVVDNVYLAYFLYAGVVGVLAFIALCGGIIRMLLRLCSREPHGPWIPLLSFFGGMLVEGFFVDNHNTVMLAAMVAVGMSSSYWLSAEFSNRPLEGGLALRPEPLWRNL